MLALATTRIDVYRDADSEAPSEDADRNLFGDEIETERQDDVDVQADPWIEDVPASLIERTQRVPDVSSGDLRAVRVITGRVDGRLDVRTGDRIFDRWNGGWYSVDAVKRPQNPAVTLDLRLELTRTDG